MKPKLNLVSVFILTKIWNLEERNGKMSGSTTSGEVKGAATVAAAAGFMGISGNKWFFLLLILTIIVSLTVLAVRYNKVRLSKKMK